MEEVAQEVNQHAKQAKQPSKSVDEVAMGFIRVANETMCRPIRALTQMRVRSYRHKAVQSHAQSCTRRQLNCR
jgi:N-methylhydantoinase A/oxoprolinase/acetone carboxylase beta subunit